MQDESAINCPEHCQRWHTPDQAAAIANVSRSTIYKWMRTGDLAYSDKDVGRRIHHPEIDRCMKANEQRVA